VTDLCQAQGFLEEYGVWKEAPVLIGTTKFEPLPDVKNIMVTGGAGFMYDDFKPVIESKLMKRPADWVLPERVGSSGISRSLTRTPTTSSHLTSWTTAHPSTTRWS
jgi:hypothetical protein